MEHAALRISTSPPSSPLSELSRSPSLPPLTSEIMDPSRRYPSPSSTATKSGSASPLKLSDESEIQVRTDGPPAKRRKVAERKPRTTEYLSLDDMDAGGAQLDRLLSALQRKKKIVVIAGAGISVSAGIPDFRSSTGLFTTLKDKHKIKGGGKQLFDASVYKDDKSTAEFHKMVRDLSQLTKKAEPTKFHHMLATIADEGRLMRLYSQNVDCIDTSMPPLATTVPLNMKGPWPTTIQLHGGLQKMQCTKCNQINPFNGELFQGPEAPLCIACENDDIVRTQFGNKRSHGIGRLRPRMVLYNEFNPDGDAIGAVSQADLRRVPDAVIVVGTSLKIPGVRRLVRELCQATRSKRDGFTAWVNLDPEPQGVDMKDLFDIVVKARCDDIADLLNLPQYDEFEKIGTKEDWLVSGVPKKEEKYVRNTSRDGIKWDDLVVKKRTLDDIQYDIKPKTSSDIGIGSKLKEQLQGPTPSASPRQQSPQPRRKALPKGRPTKQTTLARGARSTTTTQATNDTKGATTTNKATKRKPRQAKKKDKPTNSIKDSFKTTKPKEAAVLDKTPEKKANAERGLASRAFRAPAKTSPPPSEQVKAESDSDSPLSEMDESPELYSLPRLPPADERSMKNEQIKVEEEPSSEMSFHTVPSNFDHEHQTKSEIVSPSSKPRGMSNLID